MNAHDFAMKLLEGPDLPIVTPKVIEYFDGDEDNCSDPVVSKHTGRGPNDEPVDMLIISYHDESRPVPEAK